MRGHVDDLTYEIGSGWRVLGWAAHDDGAKPTDVEVCIDAAPVVSGTADGYRSDLEAAGIRGGFAAFAIAVPNFDALALGPVHVELRPSGAGRQSIGSFRLPRKRFIGTLEGLEGLVAVGWAVDVADAATHLVIDIRVDGRLVDRVVADSYRQDIEERDPGFAFHGFSCCLPVTLANGTPRRVTAAVANMGIELPGTADLCLALDRLSPELRRRIDQQDRLRQLYESLTGELGFAARDIDLGAPEPWIVRPPSRGRLPPLPSDPPSASTG